MGFNIVNFVEGYALGSGGNLKPLKVIKNGIYYPADYDCNGFNQVNVAIPNKTTLIDMLPTWGEIIVDDGWSVRIKKSDEIEEDTDDYSFSMNDSESPYLYMYQKNWTIYFCVYKEEQLLFGATQKTHTSRQWSWAMWNSVKPWLNVYAGHKYKRMTSISAEKTSSYNGLSGINVLFNFDYEWFSYVYNADGDIEQEVHDLHQDNTGKTIASSVGYYFFTKDDYLKRADDLLAYGQAVNNSKGFKYKIYDV